MMKGVVGYFSLLAASVLLDRARSFAFVEQSKRGFMAPLVVSELGATSSRDGGSDVQENNSLQSASIPRLLLTFDLDDTLFPVELVVRDANHEMLKSMVQFGIHNVTEERFMDATRSIRNDLKSPITYSDLRKRAISRFTEDDSQIPYIFNAWLDERHAAAERHLFDGALEALHKIRVDDALLCDGSTGGAICVGAITNGRGNPLCMPNTLLPYFDFCTSGEDEDVFPNRKPNKGIYEAALTTYHGDNNKETNNNQCESPKDNYIWIHVGDCLVNDVGASVDYGARAIWVDVLETDTIVDSPKRQKWSTATPSEMELRARLAGAAEHKASAKITSLSEFQKRLPLYVWKVGLKTEGPEQCSLI